MSDCCVRYRFLEISPYSEMHGQQIKNKKNGKSEMHSVKCIGGNEECEVNSGKCIV